MARVWLRGVALFVAAMAAAAAPAWGNAGALDRSFARGGVAISSFGAGSSATAQAVALAQGARIVVAGQMQPANGGATQVALARYMPSGRLDRRFGTGGVVQTAFANGASALALAIDAKGRAVVAGSSASSIAVARFTTAGRLDRSFGQGGLVLTSFPGREVGAQAIAVMAGGRIVVAGGGQRSDGTGGGFALARYLPNGALDPSFGNHGRVFTPFGVGADVSAAHSLAIWRGRVVTAGLLDNPFAGGGAFTLARYLPSGQLDPSFSSDGRVVTTLGEEAGAQGVLIVSGGRIVAAGSAQLMPGQGDQFVLTRYLTDGALDPTFGKAGVVSTNLPGGDALANAIARQRNGRLVAVGQANQPDGSTSIFGIVRYLPGGGLDRTFGTGGIVTTGFGAGNLAAAQGVAIQRNGRIVVVGGNGSSFVVARYLAS